MRITITHPELTTILGSLRLFQQDVATHAYNMSEHFDVEPPLNAEEIDSLCERLNCGPRPRYSYTVNVGNIGNIPAGTNLRAAQRIFTDYKRQSKAGIGRGAGESVSLLRDGEPIKVFFWVCTEPEEGDTL